MKNNKVFIVGATGFIGRELVSKKAKSYLFEGTSTKGGDFHKLDLLKSQEFDYGEVNKGDFVCVTSAISSPEVCSKSDKDGLAWQINVEGTKYFIKGCLANEAKVIFLSSDSIYGEQINPITEESTPKPFGKYALMKRIIEKEYEKHTNFKTIRLSYVFSRNDKFTNYLRSCFLKNKEAEVYKSFSRAVIYLSDVVEAILRLIEEWDYYKKYKIINFGGKEILSREQLASLIIKNSMQSLKYKIIDAPPAFFSIRPKQISMQSPILASILNRDPLKILEAIKLEFKSIN